MQLVATLIADPARADLGRDRIDATVHALNGAEAKVVAENWLDPGIACDLVFEGTVLAQARRAIAECGLDEMHDVVVQPAEGRRKRLLIADMDATIVAGETLDELAEKAGLKERIAAITARAMRGEIEFKAALRERVAMLEGLPVSALAETFAALRLNPGACALVRTMRAHGAFTVLISGGFRYFVGRIAERCGFDAFQANDLVIAGDRLTGRVVEPVLDKDAKLDALNRFARERATALADTLAIGDGANDLPMVCAAGLGIAYHAKPVVIAAAPAAVRHGDLTAALYIQGYSRAEFCR